MRERHLLAAAYVLALITAVIHLYWAALLFQFSYPTEGVLFAGMGVIYLVGMALVAANVMRDLWLRVGIGYVALLLIAWAADAAYLFCQACAPREPIAYADKVVEVLLLAVLVLILRQPKRAP